MKRFEVSGSMFQVLGFRFQGGFVLTLNLEPETLNLKH